MAEQDEFSIEQIMQEFGGWTQRDDPPEEQPEQPAQEQTEQLAQPEPDDVTEPAAPEAEPPLEATQPINIPPEAAEEAPETGARVQLQFVDFETAKATLPKRDVPEAAEPAPEKRRKKRKKKPAEPALQSEVSAEQPEATEETVIPLFAEDAPASEEEPLDGEPDVDALEQAPSSDGTTHDRWTPHFHRRRPEPAQPERSPQEVYQKVAAARGALHLRLIVTLLLTVVSAALTLGNAWFSGSVPFFGSGRTVSIVLLCILLATMLLSYDVLIRAIVRATELHFNLETLALIAAFLTVFDGLLSLKSGRVAYYSVENLVLFFALWASERRLDGLMRSLKAVMNATEPAAIEAKENGWKDTQLLYRDAGTFYGFVDSLEATDGAERAMRVLSPVLIVLSLLLAMLAAGRSERSLLWTWSGILSGSIPVMGFVCYARPFSRLAARLQRSGAALCGWHAAKILGDASFLTVQDADLFPRANMIQNGVKVFEGFRLGQVVAYAATVVMAAGSGLTPLLQVEMQNYGVHEYPVGNFHRYEGGGYGAEICGDVVLVGSKRFLQLMGVRIEESAELKTALYISINGSLAGLFALTYAPSSAVRAALHMVLRSRSLALLMATRDCMLTLAMVSEAYRLPADDLEFPTAEDRAHLAVQTGGRTVGLLTRDSFLPYTETVAGGATLYRVTHIGVCLSVLSSLLGLFLLAFLLAFGVAGSVAASNVLLYSAAWMIPNLLIQSLIGRF